VDSRDGGVGDELEERNASPGASTISGTADIPCWGADAVRAAGVDE